MPAALATLFATTVTLTVPSAGAPDCPSPAQLKDAIEAHVPGLVSSSATAASPTVSPPLVPPAAAATGAATATATALHLVVATLPAGDIRFDLVDAGGEALLHRVLPAPPRGHEPDCPALAETVALVVERYLHDVGYEAPPLAPPPPKPAPPPEPLSAPPALIVVRPPPAARRAGLIWRLGLAAAGRLGDAGKWDADTDLALGVEGAGIGRQLGARLSVGLALPDDARWSDAPAPAPPSANATLDRIPLRLGLYLRIPLRAGQLEPGVGAGAEALLIDATGPGTANEHHLAPFGDLALGYSIPLMGPVYLRVLSRAALEVPYDFNTFGGRRVWGTPRLYGELGVELGFAIR